MHPFWCFAKQGGDPAEGLGGERLQLSRSHLDTLPAGALGLIPVHPGTIPELYGEINKLLQAHPEWFRGVTDRQVFVPVEYQISVLKITDPLSAQAAIDQIVEEGEGIDEPAGYDSHFARFWRVRKELLEMEPSGFDPALPVQKNPVPRKNWLPYTREVSEVLDYAYVTLLFILTSLYRNYDVRKRPPYLTEALQNVAFGPMMTMVDPPHRRGAGAPAHPRGWVGDGRAGVPAHARGGADHLAAAVPGIRRPWHRARPRPAPR